MITQNFNLTKNWIDKMQFSEIFTAKTSDNMMLHPNWNQEFELHTDTSKFGCGAVLAQYYKKELRPIRCASRTFSPVESSWDTVHQELFVIKWALDNCRPYILGHRIKVVNGPC